jgi:methylmalonyl-CoA mutase N-terminal domain/subunit
MEEKICDLMKVIEEKGGFIQCFKEGWVEEQINEARYKMADAIENGEQSMVGVNIFREEDEEVKINIFRPASDMQTRRIEYIQDYKKNRDQEPVKRSLQQLSDLVRKKPEENLFEPIMRAVEARASLQEIIDAMREAVSFSIPG